MVETKISRQHLYDLVWSRPIRKIAEQLDTPYARLLRACNEANIPKPPIGYWVKSRHGTALPDKTPLGGNPDLWVTTGVKAHDSKDERHRAVVREFLSFENARVYSQLRQPHSAVKDMMLTREGGAGRLNDTTNRILRILDCIAKALEREGFNVTADPNGGLNVQWREARATVRLREKLIMPRDPDGKVNRRGGLLHTGRLYVEAPRRIEETEESGLENMVSQILHSVAIACVAQDEERKGSQERALRFAARRAEFLAERQKSGCKHNAIAKFVAASDEWHRIQRARSFLAAVERLPRTAKTFLEQDSAGWISHLRAKLGEQDPLKNGLDGLLSEITS